MFDINKYLNELSIDVEKIDISKKGLTFLPDLSRFTKLKYLNCSYNKLLTLPPLNDSLIEIQCCYNKLTSLPFLNNSLKYLYSTNNQLTSLPPLNNSLESIYCFNNKLTLLPPLNVSLQILFCSHNRLASLPPLNSYLKRLDCSHNQLTFLPQLNSTLENLYCSNNQLTTIPLLPFFLRTLDCSNNYLIYFPYLHFFLHFECENNKLFEIIDYNFINSRKKLNTLTHFREFYFLSKFRLQFHKWLWKSREKSIKERYHPKYLYNFINQKDAKIDLDNFLKNW
jgi:Leucine-rich repeat (LRR) protein